MAVSRLLIFIQKPVSVYLLPHPLPQGALTAGTFIFSSNRLPGQLETPGVQILAWQVSCYNLVRPCQPLQEAPFKGSRIKDEHLLMFFQSKL